MSAKRPRPAIPVLVHVDNPTEVGSVVVDTSTIEEKMNTVISNQERIYDKIPTSSGGGGGSSADLTTVNEKITSLATSIGPVSSTTGDNDLIGLVKNLRGAIGVFGTGVPFTENTVRSLLYNMRNAIGSVSYEPTTTGTSVRDLLAAIKENTASGGSGSSADLTTVNEKTTSMAAAIGTLSSSSKDTDLIGCVRNLRVAIGASGNQLLPSGDSIRSFLLNLCKTVGNSYDTPTSTENTIRGLLLAIKENTASGGSGGSADLTTVNEKTTSMAAAIGTTDSTYTSDDLLGRVKNLASSIGDFYLAPSATGTTIRDLLTAIKQNTASGGGGGGGSGGSADLTTVNEKTTALATAIGSADDSSSTVSVIGLLKSITDKY